MKKESKIIVDLFVMVLDCFTIGFATALKVFTLGYWILVSLSVIALFITIYDIIS